MNENKSNEIQVPSDISSLALIINKTSAQMAEVYSAIIKANIELQKQNKELMEKVNELENSKSKKK